MTISTATVAFSSGESTLQAYLARPEDTESFPAVVVIHEIFELNDNTRDIARRFAAEGYAATHSCTICLLNAHRRRCAGILCDAEDDVQIEG